MVEIKMCICFSVGTKMLSSNEPGVGGYVLAFVPPANLRSTMYRYHHDPADFRERWFPPRAVGLGHCKHALCDGLPT